MDTSSKRRIKKKSKRKRQSSLKKKKIAHEKKRGISKEKREREYPIFIYEDYDKNVVPEQFVVKIKKILGKIRFNDRSLFLKDDQDFFKMMKKYGFETLTQEVPNGFPYDESVMEVIRIRLSFLVGEIVYRELAKMGLIESFVPYNDVRITPIGTDFIVGFNSLLWEKTSRGRIYYSPIRPKMEINGKQWTVAFTRHAIERICDRCVGLWKVYAGASDAFGLIYYCSLFHACKSPHFEKDQDFITFYAECRRGFCYEYIDGVLEDYNLDKSYFYRVGYCPIGFSGNFASAITMLSPGMRGTPEYNLLENSDLSTKTKRRFKKQIKTSINWIKFANSGNFEAIKWFHTNGIPQVIELDDNPSIYTINGVGRPSKRCSVKDPLFAFSEEGFARIQEMKNRQGIPERKA
jgi:hypothetical protein